MGEITSLINKNWILYKRAWFGNCLQLIIPVAFSFLVAFLLQLTTPIQYAEQSFVLNNQYFRQIDNIHNYSSLLPFCQSGQIIGLAPSPDPLTDHLFTMLLGLGSIPHKFNTEADLQAYVRSPYYNTQPNVCGAITVISSTSSNYQYKIRLKVQSPYDNSDGPNPDSKLTVDQIVDLQAYQAAGGKGFYGLNMLVNNAILQILQSDNTLYFRQILAPMYQQKVTLDQNYQIFKDSISILVILPLLIIYLRQTAFMLYQKQTKIRQCLYIMGMKVRNYYLTWFLRYFLVYLVIHLITAFLFFRQLKYVPFYIIFTTFILFDIVIIIQNMFIQTFITKSKVGIVICLVFYLLQYIISMLSESTPSLQINFKKSLVPHCAVIMSLKTFLYVSSNQITPGLTDENNLYILGYTIISLCGNIILYLILTWYFDQVIPNQFGSKKHPLFCLLNKSSQITNDQKQRIKISLQKDVNYKRTHQEIDKDLKILQKNQKMVEIVALTKQFDNDITAVDNLTISMFQGQIFAFLGHNGAGKTTTLSMLTGMLQPTSGYISVFGQTQIQSIRSIIGICPQHDTLYDQLTVQQHLILYGTIKGLSGNQLDNQVNKLIQQVNLSQKRDQYSKNLSGGQKRRLSVAMAFSGRSKVIILDEPTSGMDTASRRFIWELLKSFKKDRVIILTTHFMDEADFLGDRIGIMNNGRMACCGSSIFLKNKFGAGYTLTFTKQNSTTSSQPIISTVKKYSRNANVLSDVAADVSIRLPFSDSSNFPDLFQEIDDKKGVLRYAEYGISITTLQQVFLKVIEQQDDIRQDQNIKQSLKSNRKIKPNQVFDQNQSYFSLDQLLSDQIPRYQNSCYIFCLHFKATFLKRLRVIMRDWKSLLFQLFLPMLVITFAMLLLKISFIYDMGSQRITPSLYLTQQNPVIIPIGADNAANAINYQTTISSNANYGSIITVMRDPSSTTTSYSFDQNYLFPIKKQKYTLKGGIFFDSSPITDGTNTIYPFTVLVNTRSATSPYLLTNIATEAILSRVFSKSTSIIMNNHPLPKTFQQLQINSSISGFFAGFVFSIALSFKFASIMSFIVKQRQDRSKHQQIVSGMSVSVYWFANFVYDYIIYALILVFSIFMVKVFKVNTFTDNDAYVAVILLFAFYGVSYTFLTYILTFLYKDYGSAQAGHYFMTFIIGGIIPILTFLLRIVSQNLRSIGKLLAWILRAFPSFAFGEGLLNIGSVGIYNTVQKDNYQLSAFPLNIALGPILMLIIQSIFYPVILLFIQILMNSQSFMRFWTSQATIQNTRNHVQDDVLKQEQKALKANPKQYQILTKNLRKVYLLDGVKNYKVAVDKLSFGVKKGEVFGLLGVNGAGKTTTFKMLSGQITSTAGDCYFNGLRISENLQKIRQSLGYCPQFDALVDNLTVRQQLQLFYDLKSLNGEFKQEIINNKIQQMDLTKYADKLSGTLSGGNKRKLSVAMAMIGNPRIVFLDQPSTGMDPKARRYMWKVISKVATEKRNCTVILTTHSMQQAQALSSRLGIMVNGNFQCIGTVQHIKSKYGDGFEIEIKLNNISKRNIAFLIKKYKIVDTHIRYKQIDYFYQLLQISKKDQVQIEKYKSGHYIYQILRKEGIIDVQILIQFFEILKIQNQILVELNQTLGRSQIIQKLHTFMRVKVRNVAKVSKLFNFFEKNKERLFIQQYNIKQATVQQIFNKFAQENQQNNI